ncbi:MAG: hypothetical protein Q8916_02925 [Bacteroidota bacterium]|nr:hypothetical protein [Bacteroidota bacterium]MDP4229340.1 hypothetical protein [Bacteroidota bacterium]MDP4236771.1 hypothetical protein [Bacteroidota bacterium]
MKIFLALFIAGCLSASSLRAQDEYTAYHWKDHWVPTWMEMRGSFLEPNRFGTAFDFKPQWWRLEAGFGGEITRLGTVALGAEGLIWSGLKAYSDFRFPVQTADYFFGIYSIFPLPIWGGNLRPWRMRFRLSHISSHLVDGAENIVGGSSSHFSREFVSLETLFDETERSSFRLSLGVKYVFHQVEDIEQRFQFPGVLDFIVYNDAGNQFFATLSTAAGPTLAAYSAGLTYRRTMPWSKIADLYAEYHTGRTRYGAEGDIKQDGFEIGIRLGSAKDLEPK